MKKFHNLNDILQIESETRASDLPTNTYDMIREAAENNPSAPALSFFLRPEDHRNLDTWTYQELFEDITRAANLFHGLGIEKDDVIAFVLPNLPETHLCIWGGQAAGIVMPINPLLESQAIAELLCAADAKVFVTLAPFPGVDIWAKVQPILHQVPSLRHVVLVDLSRRVRGLKKLAARFMQKREEHRQAGPNGIASVVPNGVHLHYFDQELKRQQADRLVSQRRIKGDDFSSFFCTGGTTGAPKIAMRRHRNEAANAWSAGVLFNESMGTSKTLFCGLPLFHVNAVLVTGLLPFSKGAHVILGTPQGYRAPGLVEKFWEIVEAHRINFFSGVPTLFSSLLQVPVEGRNVSSLEFAICGAAPLPVEVLKTFEARTGIKILEGYGLTEATCVSSCNPLYGERKSGSIGLRIPLQGMKAVTVDDKSAYLRDCEVDEVGLIVVSGPNVFEGYKVPEHNKGLWIDMPDGSRWLNTGDLGRQDADGYFFLTGRKKELIIRGGHNIDPQMIEEPLHRHPAVHLASAIGRPDAHAGELPVVYVQLRPGAQVTEDELLAFAQSAISERAAWPKVVRIVDHLPQTAVGKIFKPALKEREAVDALRAELAKANISVPALAVETCPKRGTVINVTIAHGSDELPIRKALGVFPFPIEFQVKS